MPLRVKRLRGEAKLPTRAYEKALAYDIYFCPEDGERVTLLPVSYQEGTGVYKLGTGIGMELPEGKGMIFRERGSTGIKGLSIRAGVIDEDFRGEFFILLQNLGNAPIIINPGDKLIQGILIPTPDEEVIEVDELDQTQRGDKVLGSSN